MKPFELAPLPYAYDYLEPVIDAETMKLHHDKHHQAYVNNLNAAIAKYPDLAYGCVDCILGNIANVPEDIRQAVINNGGGHKNHTMFWDIMTKPDTSKLQGPLKDAIDADLGGYDAFVESFSNAAATRFGSGWAWLVVNNTLGTVPLLLPECISLASSVASGTEGRGQSCTGAYLP